MRRAALVLLVLLALAASSVHSARLFDTKKRPLKRELGKRKKGKGGHVEVKEVDASHFGHAAFDPTYSGDDDVGADDLGFKQAEMHHATPEVVKARLKELFPLIDTNHDGAVSLSELQHHLYLNGLHISRRKADAEFAQADTNQDGKVTAAEYLTDFEGDSATTIAAVGAFASPHPLDWAAFTDVTLESMVLADVNHDKGLDHTEFYGFLNPEEGHNEALKLHKLRSDLHDHLEKLHVHGIHSGDDHLGDASHGEEHHDDAHHEADHHEAHHGAHQDGHREDPHEADPHEHNRGHDAQHADVDEGSHHDWDLRLDFEDFYKTFWQDLSKWELGEDGHRLETQERMAAERRFVVLDTDADQHVSAEELLPVFHEIHPPESAFARVEAEGMWEEANVMGDRLTLDQMLKSPEVFYGVIQEEHHEELR